MMRIGAKDRRAAVVGWAMLAAGLWLLHGYYEGGGRPKPPGAGMVLPW